MSFIEKDYFTLEEIEARWGMPRRDLVYLAENGLLKVSVRLFGAVIETGYIEEDQESGQGYTVPCSRDRYRGLMDLRDFDAYKIFTNGSSVISAFDALPMEYAHLLSPEDGLTITTKELVIRREERDRVELKHNLTGDEDHPTNNGLKHNKDFTEVSLNGQTYNLGPIQADVVSRLHRSMLDGGMWRSGKQVLAEAGSQSHRMQDVFKSQKNPSWRELIVSNKRGLYRLNVDLRKD
ncbi:hypothetical protein [Pseudemcibacter aquimaris]|uniref:hypothetical protein n=1 Tax=Pseudemcibacter aquimaris TaxID=2857064 RepID=UPI002011F66A|nr:hypothetical protein [Pseudemcibacter aquimaris]MCC3861775.1 hypothetical protein [Pseudemcibacter aquimaris]WDU57888.1 hypothetical protein KW060_11835 [Pseudemcibacter aquimaris]